MALHAWLSEIFNARSSSKRRIGKKSAQEFSYLMVSLGDSPRRCMNPVDYVYGVLGIFQLKIPRMNDPNAVWRLFYLNLTITWKRQVLRTRSLVPEKELLESVIEHTESIYRKLLI